MSRITTSQPRPRLLDARRAHVGRARALLVGDGDVETALEDPELLHRGGCLTSAATSIGRRLLVTQVLGQLRAGGRLARALQPGHQDDGGSTLRDLERRVLGPHELHELGVDRVDELVRGLHPLEPGIAQSALFDALGEVPSEAEADVGLQERLAHGAQAISALLSVSSALPRKKENEPVRRSVRVSNMALRVSAAPHLHPQSAERGGPAPRRRGRGPRSRGEESTSRPRPGLPRRLTGR